MTNLLTNFKRKEVDFMMTLKEATVKQFEYCKAIAEDILANGKSKEVQEYAKKYAEIESPLVGGTDAEWIRINWGDIYIFLHDNGNINYQLDPHGEYGGELIDVQTKKNFGNFLISFQKMNLWNIIIHLTKMVIIQRIAQRNICQ